MKDLSEFFEPGLSVKGEETSLRSARSRGVLSACSKHKAFSVLQLRQWDDRFDGPCDVVVVDCVCDQVPSKESNGILRLERLGLVIPVAPHLRPWVYALRTDFPRTLHQNLVTEGEPRSLCLYESWEDAELTWSPRKYLERVLWWLGATANDASHDMGQALEPAFLRSAQDLVIPAEVLVSPAEFKDGLFASGVRREAGCTMRLLTLRPDQIRQARKQKALLVHVVLIETPEQVHQVYDRTPRTLRLLADYLDARGIDLGARISGAIVNAWKSAGEVVATDGVVIVGVFPVKRSANARMERMDVFAFFVDAKLADLAIALGLAEMHGGHCVLLVGAGLAESTAWLDLPVELQNVCFEPSEVTLRQLSGITKTLPTKAVAVGAGALGSHVLNCLVRAGWTAWTVVDKDHLLPHNLVRHLAKNIDIGKPKAQFLAEDMNAVFSATRPPTVQPVVADVQQTESEQLRTVLQDAEFVLDTTASVRASRTLGRVRNCGRVVTCFVNAAGTDFVLLAEDAARQVHMDELEPQYWRWVLTHEWGASHIGATDDRYRFGGRCGDLSSRISESSMSIASGVLAGGVLGVADSSDSAIRIWRSELQSGAVQTLAVSVEAPEHYASGPWQVVCNTALRDRVLALREEGLPEETGGAILGYVDRTVGTVYVVDLLSAPAGSVATEHLFDYGNKELRLEAQRTEELTAGYVQIVGLWHSHPRGASSAPSPRDEKLMGYLLARFGELGDPAVMLVVGEDGLRWWIDEQ